MTNLPPSDIERIEDDIENRYPEAEHGSTEGARAREIAIKAYVSGAQAEAVRGREMAIGFVEWKEDNAREDKCYCFTDGAMMWHLKKPKVGESQREYRTSELFDLYILDTQKRKG